MAQQGEIFKLALFQCVVSRIIEGGGRNMRSRLDLAGQMVGILCGKLSKFIPHIFEAFQKPRRKFPAFSIQNHTEGLAGGDGFFIHAVCRERIVAVRDGHHLCADGDAVPFQAIRITISIPSLVMIAADPVGIFKILLIPQTVQVCEKLAAFHRMGLHDFEFFICQLPGLVENTVGNGNLTDVVQGRGLHNELDLPAVQVVDLVVLRHVLQQNLCEHPDAADMLTGFKAAVFDDRGEHIDHRGIGLPRAGGLFRDHRLQLPPVAAQFNNIFNTVFNFSGIEGLGDDIGCAQFKYPGAVSHAVVRRDHDDW